MDIRAEVERDRNYFYTRFVMDHGQAAAGGAVIVILVISLVFFGLWIWSLVHCINNKRLSSSNRTLGIILIAVMGLLGSLIYLFLPQESTRSRYGSRSTSRLKRGRGQPQRGTNSYGAGGRSMARSRR